MNEEKKSQGDMIEPGTQASPFIPCELRPAADTGEVCPVIAPDAPVSELRRRASEALGYLLRGRRGEDRNGRAAALTPDQVFTRNDNAIFTEVLGEAVILDVASGYYFSLNAPGTVIWQMLTPENSLGKILGAVCERFDVPPETAWEDLTALIRNLCSEKLVKLEAPAHAPV